MSDNMYDDDPNLGHVSMRFITKEGRPILEKRVEALDEKLSGPELEAFRQLYAAIRMTTLNIEMFDSPESIFMLSCVSSFLQSVLNEFAKHQPMPSDELAKFLSMGPDHFDDISDDEVKEHIGELKRLHNFELCFELLKCVCYRCDLAVTNLAEDHDLID